MRSRCCLHVPTLTLYPCIPLRVCVCVCVPVCMCLSVHATVYMRPSVCLSVCLWGLHRAAINSRVTAYLCGHLHSQEMYRRMPDNVLELEVAVRLPLSYTERERGRQRETRRQTEGERSMHA
jgi:hypothetical protein